MAPDRVPNLRSLQVFEAVARLGSIVAAASELGISQSAVSHQLRLLTDEVGERLLVKAGRGVALTEAGRALGSGLQGAFADIRRFVSKTTGAGRETLRLAVCSSFAPGWLIPRLPAFVEQHPRLDLQLRMYARQPELTDQVADAFVTTLPEEPGFLSLKLLAERLVPVFASKHAPFVPGSMPLITTDLAPERPLGEDWRRYASLAGLELDQLRMKPWLQASHYILALDMVREGLGIALVPDFLAAREIDRGTLTQLGDVGVHTHEDYHLCVKTTRQREPALQALAQWFKGQVGDSRDS